MKGILMKPELIRAIVNGSKTQTRRVIKLPKTTGQPIVKCEDCGDWAWQNNDGFWHHLINLKPRYRVGEVVYIKEAAWYGPQEKRVEYDLTKTEAVNAEFYGAKKRSPLFMPAWAARYFIKITNVRACQTKDITFEDCLAEGVVGCKFWGEGFEPEAAALFNAWYDTTGCKVPLDDYIDAGWIAYARSVYFALYNNINGKGSHETNWDWRYEFTLNTLKGEGTLIIL